MKYRSVQYGVLFIFMIGALVLILSMLFYYKVQQKKNHDISEISYKQRVEMIDNVLSLKSQHYEAVVHENSAWDELVDFVNAKDKNLNWVHDNIGQMAESYDAAEVAIYDVDGDPVYLHASNNYNKIDFFNDIRVNTLLTKNYKTKFFNVRNNQIFQYFCAGIVSSDDINSREENYQGYLILIREINSDLLKQYSGILGEIEVHSTLDAEYLEKVKKAYSKRFFYFKELNNQFGQPVAYLYFTGENSLNVVFDSFLPVILVISSIVLLIFILLFIFVRFRIVRPIKRIVKTFISEDFSKIKKLKKSSTEFGVLANTVENFLAQKHKIESLYGDLEQKQQELVSQNEMLSEQKKEIESQIANIQVLNRQIMERNRETEKKNVQISVQNQQLTEQSESIRKVKADLESLSYRFNFTSNQLDQATEELLNSRNYASRLRNLLMVASTPTAHIFNEFFVFQLIKNKIGGDFTFAKKIDHWIIAGVGDCNLSGIPGALLSALDIYLLNEIIDFSKAEDFRPNTILNSLNKRIISSIGEELQTDFNRDGLHISILMYNTQSLKGYFAAAKRTMVVMRRGEDVEYFGDNLAVGKIADERKFRVVEIQFQPDDVVYMYSDGSTEIVGGPFCKNLTPKNFKNLLRQKYIYPLEGQKAEFARFYSEWIADLEQSDDITILGFKI